MVLPQLPKLPKINEDKSEKSKIIKDVEGPEEDRDVVTKGYADATYTQI